MVLAQPIGGIFGLEPLQALASPLLPLFQYILLWTCNARSALYIVLNEKKITRIWLPSYLCPELLKAISTSTEICFYPLSEGLEPLNLEWLNDIKAGDSVLYIDYFGFEPAREFLTQLKETPALVIEDASQAFLSDFIAKQSGLTLVSPRKFLGVPDGGLLLGNTHYPVILESPPWSWWHKALQANLLRREFDLGYTSSHDWYALFQESEAQQSVGYYSMSELSRRILTHAIDYQNLAQKRRENYLTLLTELKAVALFPHLPSDTVPLGFPVCLKNRDEVRNILINNQIYPPVHWKIAERVPLDFKESHHLSSQILTLPCDQRYGELEMKFMAELILTNAH